jgi:hypothetical protein
MAMISPSIAAIAVPVTGTIKQGGLGLVERQVDHATYAIRTRAGNIAVRVTEGALDVGQRVNILVRNGMLLIEPLDQPAPDAGAVGGDDSFMQSSGIPAPRLKGTLAAIIGALSANPSGAQVYRQNGPLFAAITPALFTFDRKLTEDILQRFNALASGPEASPVAPEQADELIRLLEVMKKEISDAPLSAPPLGRTVAVEEPLPEGLYSFSSVDDTLRFLGIDRASAPAFAAEAEARLSEDGVIIVRTLPAPGGRASAMLLLPEEVSRDLESLTNDFESRTFRSIPAAVFEQVLDDRNNLDIALLRLLDQTAKTLQLPAASARAGSVEAQAASLRQWLHALSDSPAPSAALVSLVPVFPASSIADAIDEVAAAAGKQLLPPLETFAPTSDSFSGPAEKATFFDAAFKNLGLDFERSLLVAGTPEKESLKARILELIRATGTPSASVNGPAAGVPTRESFPDMPVRIPAALFGFKQEQLTIIARTFTAAILPSGAPLPDRAVQELNDSCALVEQELKRSVEMRVGELKEQIEPAGGFSQGPATKTLAASDVPGTAVGKNSGPETSTAFFTEAGNRAAAVLDLLKTDIENRIQKLVQQFVKSENLPQFQAMRNALAACAADLVRNIEEFRLFIAGLPESSTRTALSGTVLRGGDAADHARPKMDVSVQTGTMPGDPDETGLSRTAVRQQLETLLTRVESLQLLARPTATAAGDQQIVALPVKIGNEWTELQVRFVRRRNRKGGTADRSHFTVYLNVAPSFLGAIGARLEYHRKKSCFVGITFESDETRQWFGAHKTMLRKSLAAIGLPSPQVELYAAKKEAPPKGLQPVSLLSNTAIDLKV